MSLSKELMSQDNKLSSIDNVIIAFVRKTSEPMITNIIATVNGTVQETSPVLSAFNLFNPDAVFKDIKSWKDLFKTLTNHYSQVKTDHYENNTTTAIPIIDAVQVEVEYEDFMDEFDEVVLTLNDNL